MKPHDRVLHAAEQRKRNFLQIILVLAWLSTVAAWTLMSAHRALSPALRGVLLANLIAHPLMFLIVRKRLLPQRVIEMSCLLFAAAICAGCMVLRLYFPAHGADIDLKPLYLWIPTIYVFAFTLTSHKLGLIISLVIMGLFFGISLPYLIHHATQPDGNFTIQLLAVSAVLIASLYLFSSYQHRLQVAQLTVDELGRLANTDVLTKLPNRRRITEIVASELVRSARYERAFSLILIDIDHFKAVNDHLGHMAGDHALVALTTRANEILRDVDTLGRWGGEEFIVVLPETALNESLRKAEALCAHVAAQPLIGEHTVTISCGVANVRPGDTATSLFQRADVALYAAKKHGRNQAQSEPVT